MSSKRISSYWCL